MAVIRNMLCTVMLFLIIGAISTPDADARSIKAYFNEQEATVENVSLHVGEPFSVDLYVTPDGDSFVYAIITEPGYTSAYDRIAGDAIGDTLARQCNESSPAHFNWTLAANDQWVDGTAPVNIYCQLNRKGDTNPYARAYFTVVEATILPAEKAAVAQESPTLAEGLPVWTVIFAMATIALLIKKKC